MTDSSEIRIVARFTVGQDKISEAEAIVAQMNQNAGGSGASRFETRMSDDHSELSVEATVEGSMAAQELIMRIGPDLEKLEESAQLNGLECFGDLSDPLKKSLLPFGARFKAH